MEKKVQLLPLSEEEVGVLRDLLKTVVPIFKTAKVGGFLEQTMLKVSVGALDSILNKLNTGDGNGRDESGRSEGCCHK